MSQARQVPAEATSKAAPVPLAGSQREQCAGSLTLHVSRETACPEDDRHIHGSDQWAALPFRAISYLGDEVFFTPGSAHRSGARQSLEYTDRGPAILLPRGIATDARRRVRAPPQIRCRNWLGTAGACFT
jgi:hypothetical protein